MTLLKNDIKNQERKSTVININWMWWEYLKKTIENNTLRTFNPLVLYWEDKTSQKYQDKYKNALIRPIHKYYRLHIYGNTTNA